MSEENVELVRRLQPPPGVDLTQILRDEDFRLLLQDLSPLFSDGFVAVSHALGSDSYRGIEGLRQLWLDWLAPWDSYHVEIEKLTDAGDRVLVHTRDRGRRRGMDAQVEVLGGAVWTVEGGQVFRAEFFPDRAEALEAAGLSE